MNEVTSSAIVVSNVQLAEGAGDTRIAVSEILAMVDSGSIENGAAVGIVKMLRDFLVESASIASQLRAITVVDQDTADLAGMCLQQRADFKYRVQEWFKPMKGNAKSVLDAVTQSEKLVLAGFGGADAQQEVRVRQSIVDWAEEKERQDNEANLEASRRQQELDRKARDTSVEQAKLHGAGEEAIEQLRTVPLPPAAPKLAPSFRKPAGVSLRKGWVWVYETTKEAAIKAIVKNLKKNPRLIEYLEINEGALTGDARTKQSMASVPGVIFKKETGTSVRRG